ncbi:CHAT domain-containing protein [Haliscomenobacter hydrossis]|uniref:CHAT domain-containing protein n=1 Tax=Haliscomenobacter hydrossis (strain ATCC 27775 / DSM 1100 / LMG 10767 / O) TaxID=760192 RepID=F4KTP5_HALH1|nr:CHAT domain-containing tetratricopeptide repeat protein [Haliscomenobacter hydrossis]AEE53419.1 hypothetical protein Halhy_5595 [Haliscomenobacter hydrossis DSM 1100]
MKRTSIYSPFLIQILFFIGNGAIAAQSVQDLQASFDASRSAGDMKAAIPFAEKIIVVLEQQGTPNKTLYTQKLVQLSRSYNHDFRRKDAEQLSLKALSVNPLKDTLYADALIEWCFAIGGQGQYVRADSIAQLAINLRRQLLGENNLPFGVALFASAGMKFQGGQILQAIHTFEQCRALWRKNNLGRPDMLVQILSYLGNSYYISGKSSKAELLYKESITLRNSLTGLNKIAFMETSNLANILIGKGQYTEADQLIEALQITLQDAGILHDPRYADIFLVKAQLLGNMNQHEEAISSVQKGKSILMKAFGANNPYLFQYDNLMANAWVSAGKPEEAIKVYRSALDSMKVLGGEAWIEYSMLKGGLANAYVSARNYQGAIDLYLESIAYYEKTGDSGYDVVLKSMYLGLCEAYRYVHNYVESRKYLQKFEAIGIPDNAKDNWAAFLNAELSFVEKNYPVVVPSSRTYTETIKKQIGNEIFLFDDQKRQSQIQDVQHAANAVLTLIKADASQKNIPELVDIFLDFQLFKKSLLLTASQRIRSGILNGTDDKLKERYNNWIDQKDELAYYYTRPRAELVAENIELPQLEARIDSLEKILARSNTAYNMTTNDLKINWKMVRAALQPGQAALEIVRWQGQLYSPVDSVHYAVFILTPDRPEPALAFIADGDRLEQVLLEKHLLACTSPQSAAPTSDLYNAVWKNIEPYVKNAKTIFVAADGCFHKINFATLRQPDNTYLADRYNFQPVFSLKDILKEPGTVVASRSAFLLGNPAFSPEKNTEAATASRSRTIENTAADTTDYAVYNPLGILRDLNATRGIELKSLPGSQKEVDDLSALLQRNGWQTTLYTGTKAREEEVKSLRSPRVMHLATHGYFLANERAGTAGLSRETVVRNPLLRSMLFFAGAQNTLDRKPLDQKDDGILTAYEVQNMNLDGTELVVLSACKTGQGKVQNGEGVYGLQRALRIAGAQNLLLSLWDVDDEVGRTFMQTFYEQWLGGKSKPEAFRYTQLAIKAKYPHPFYWAGFILIGN